MNPLINCSTPQKTAIIATFVSLCKLEPNNISTKEIEFVKKIAVEINFDIDLTLLKLTDKLGENDRLLLLNSLAEKHKEYFLLLINVMSEIDPFHGDWSGKSRFPVNLAKNIGITEENSERILKEAVKYLINMTY